MEGGGSDDAVSCFASSYFFPSRSLGPTVSLPLTPCLLLTTSAGNEKTTVLPLHHYFLFSAHSTLLHHQNHLPLSALPLSSLFPTLSAAAIHHHPISSYPPILGSILPSTVPVERRLPPFPRRTHRPLPQTCRSPPAIQSLHFLTATLTSLVPPHRYSRIPLTLATDNLDPIRNHRPPSSPSIPSPSVDTIRFTSPTQTDSNTICALPTSTSLPRAVLPLFLHFRNTRL